jgi:hypothetical protein
VPRRRSGAGSHSGSSDHALQPEDDREFPWSNDVTKAEREHRRIPFRRGNSTHLQV